jgi:hypothetical protein
MNTIAVPLIPNPNSELNNQNHRFRRTIIATTTVAQAVEPFYRLFLTIGFLLIMIVSGIIAMIIRSMKINTCVFNASDLAMFIIFGIFDIITCLILILLVCVFLFLY